KREGKKPCPISVNLSCESLMLKDFAGVYARMCHAHSIDTNLIEFEISEKFFSFDLPTQRKVIDEIHSYGFRCSLDNIGKHTIPLHLLRELEVDAIKLDSSLFTHENNSRRNRFTIEAILKLASQMQLQTVAEGIDNASQIQYLKQAACDIVQGFYYFKPMPIDEFQRVAYLDGDLRFVETDDSHEANRTTLPQHTANSNNIIMFTMLINEDRVEFSSPFSPVLDGEQTFTNAMSLFHHSELIHENDRRDFFHLLERCKKDTGWVENTLRFYTSVGHYEWLEVRMHKENIQTAGETVISGTLVNITGWKNEVNRWKEKANRDALTGLYNREFFEQTASDTLKKDTLTSAAMVFIDIDDFKQVNDTLGHMIGDDVICWVAKRILGVFRHTDVVARYGGDEFVVFANGIGREDLKERLTQLCDVFKYPYRNGTIEYIVSGSIGAALFPDDGSAYRELLDHADGALYTAKRQGKNRYVLYEPGMEAEEA
ncbi:MAG: GGDEF domain-containing protein, partial [Christensenellaceae bacterium]|nr:GGDEF domain-containing protein [Christensenellaceae bacterium]